MNQKEEEQIATKTFLSLFSYMTDILPDNHELYDLFITHQKLALFLINNPYNYHTIILSIKNKNIKQYPYLYHMFKYFILKNYKSINISLLLNINNILDNIISKEYLLKQLHNQKKSYFNKIDISIVLNDKYFNCLTIKKYFSFNDEEIYILYNIFDIEDISYYLIGFYLKPIYCSISDFLLTLFLYIKDDNINLFFNTFNKKIRYSSISKKQEKLNNYKSKTFNLMTKQQKLSYVKFLYKNKQKEQLNELLLDNKNNEYTKIIENCIFAIKLNT